MTSIVEISFFFRGWCDGSVNALAEEISICAGIDSSLGCVASSYTGEGTVGQADSASGKEAVGRVSRSVNKGTYRHSQ